MTITANNASVVCRYGLNPGGGVLLFLGGGDCGGPNPGGRWGVGRGRGGIIGRRGGNGLGW